MLTLPIHRSCPPETAPPASRFAGSPARKREQMHEARVEAKRAAADAIGVDAQFLTQPNGREAVGRRGEGGVQELRLIEGRPVFLLVPSQRLQCRTADQFWERVSERALRAE